MPKQKTHKGISKRTKLTKNGKKGGKIMRRKTSKGKEAKKRKVRRANKTVEVSARDKKVIKKLRGKN